MSERRGHEEHAREVADSEDAGEVVAAATPESAPQKAPALRLKLEEVFVDIVDFLAEATAAAAGSPLLRGAGSPSRRARRSSRDRTVEAETARVPDRENFGAIAMNNSSEHQVPLDSAES